MNKKDFSEKWSKLLKKYRCGREILGLDRDFILEACQNTSQYSTNANKDGVKVKIRNIEIASGRKVRMFCLEFPGYRQPVSKSKVVEYIYPTKRRKVKVEDNASAVRSAMRLAIRPQVLEFREQTKFPMVCWETGERIFQGMKYDIDHRGKPFVQIADEFVASKGLTYPQIQVAGPVNAKRLKNPTLQEEWVEWHREEARLGTVIASVNRGKGAGDYKTPPELLQ